VATPYWARVRTYVEDCFAAYPEEHAADLRERFRSSRWSDHAGAWWELYLFTMFRRLGCEVEVHPALPNITKRPDFKVDARDKSFYVEARHVAAGPTAGEQVVGSDEWITGPLDELAHPRFMVVVRILRRHVQQPPRRAVTARVLPWLDSLDPDAVAADPFLDRWMFRQDDAAGWAFELRPLAIEARAESERGLVGIFPGHSGYDNTVTALRAALKEKAAKYGHTGAPFVLAPLLTSGFADNDDIVQALFGSEAVVIDTNRPDNHEVIRRPDGFWISRGGFRGTRISAVLVGQGATPWTAAGPLPRLWINPAAARPLPSDFGLPTARVGDDGHVVVADGRRDAAALFGLAADWPGPERPFEA
jgi:hypothetical protein